MADRLEKGLPLWGKSDQPEWVQGAAYRNSAFSQLKMSEFILRLIFAAILKFLQRLGIFPMCVYSYLYRTLRVPMAFYIGSILSSINTMARILLIMVQRRRNRKHLNMSFSTNELSYWCILDSVARRKRSKPFHEPQLS